VFEMSEMKPVGRVDGRYSDDRAMVRTLDAGSKMPLGTELYTAKQLAEAVAAERERCAKLCDDLCDQWAKCRNPKLSDAQYWEGKVNAALDCAAAIRSAAK